MLLLLAQTRLTEALQAWGQGPVRCLGHDRRRSFCRPHLQEGLRTRGLGPGLSFGPQAGWFGAGPTALGLRPTYAARPALFPYVGTRPT